MRITLENAACPEQRERWATLLDAASRVVKEGFTGELKIEIVQRKAVAFEVVKESEYPR